MKRSRKIVLLLFIVLGVVLILGGRLTSHQRRSLALYDAVERSDLNAVTTLLREGADPNARAPLQLPWIARHAPNTAARPSALRCALDHAVLDTFRSARIGPVDKNRKIVEALLNAGATPAPDDGGPKLLEQTLTQGQTRLDWASQALLQRGAPLPHRMEGRAVIVEAIRYRNSPLTIDALLHAGAEARGTTGELALTALYADWTTPWRTPQENIAILRSLLAAGADPNAPYQQSTLLYEAVLYHQFPLAETLLQAHANPNLIPPSGDLPLLSYALESKPELLQCVLEAGGDANVRDRNGESVFWYALIHKMQETPAEKARKVALMLQHGADVHARLNLSSGPTTLLEAAHRGAGEWHIAPEILALLDKAAASKAPSR